MPKVDLREFAVGPGDLVTVLELEDRPRTVVFVAETQVDGTVQRRLVQFPLDPGLLSYIAQQCMRIADIEQISVSKRRGEANVQFGPTYAQEMYRRTTGEFAR